ncbi:ion transporter [Zavarzinia sp. CC-PAN008]|uniref:ion transporter n=1 Tax=Zavarzinia sp. CC-PAN008 TaxID=3243332 RepID=UPI003F7490C6
MSLAQSTQDRHWRARLATFVESRPVQRFITTLIIINAAILGLETAPSIEAAYGGLLRAVDGIILAIFVVEVAARILAHGWAFFRDPWSLFDFVVVGIALVPATGALGVLRALRVLRVLRLLTMMPRMRRVVGSLLGAIPGLGSIIAVTGIIFYVSAVMATRLFGQSFPELFGTLGASAFTLFQIMTLENWAEIVRNAMEVYPYAWIFFLSYILIATFTMLNLFVAVIVGAMQAEHEADQREQKAAEAQEQEDRDERLLREILALRQEVAALRAATGPAGQPAG